MPRRSIENRIKRGSTEWINVVHPTKADFVKIGKQMKLSDENLEMIMKKNHRSRLFESNDNVVIILIQPSYSLANNDVTLREIDIILSANKVVTIQRAITPNIKKLFSEIKNTKSHDAMKHPASLVGVLMHELVLEHYAMLDDIAKKLDQIEEKILKDKHVLGKVLAMQTNIIDVQKTLENQNIMLDRLLATVSKQTAKFLENKFNDLRLHLSEIQTSLRMEQMTAETLHRTHETALNARTNSQIRMLTTISLVVLPATLLAGIFGMNINFPIIVGLPGDFWIILAIMAASGLTIHFYGKADK